MDFSLSAGENGGDLDDFFHKIGTRKLILYFIPLIHFIQVVYQLLKHFLFTFALIQTRFKTRNTYK